MHSVEFARVHFPNEENSERSVGRLMYPLDIFGTRRQLVQVYATVFHEADEQVARELLKQYFHINITDLYTSAHIIR